RAPPRGPPPRRPRPAPRADHAVILVDDRRLDLGAAEVDPAVDGHRADHVRRPRRLAKEGRRVSGRQESPAAARHVSARAASGTIFVDLLSPCGGMRVRDDDHRKRSSMPYTDSKRRNPAAAAVLALLIAGLLLGRWRGSTKGASPASSSSARSPSKDSSTTQGGSSGGSSAGDSSSGGSSSGGSSTNGSRSKRRGVIGARVAALRSCLQKNGIALPRRAPGQGATPGGATRGPGGGLRLPKGVTRAQFQATLKKCGGANFLRAGRARNGPVGTRQRAARYAKFAACMRRNGVNVPPPNTSDKGPIFNTKGLDTNSSTFKAADAKCMRELAPARAGAGAAAGGPGGAGGAPGGGPLRPRRTSPGHE